MPARSFVEQFKKEYCGVHKKAQWKKELRNLRQGPQETVETYTAKIKELWHRIDSDEIRDESDRVMEFIEGLRNEFIIQIQGIIPQTVEEAVDRAKAIEIALVIKKERNEKSLSSKEVKE